MDVVAVLDGGDFNARDQLDAGVTGGGPRRVDARGRVVIGDADNRKARRAGPGHEIRRRERAVGCRGV